LLFNKSSGLYVFGQVIPKTPETLV
jgi:hypothetical protein